MPLHPVQHVVDPIEGLTAQIANALGECPHWSEKAVPQITRAIGATARATAGRTRWPHPAARRTSTRTF